MSLAIVRDTNEAIAPAAPPPQRLALNQFERRAVTGLVEGCWRSQGNAGF